LGKEAFARAKKGRMLVSWGMPIERYPQDDLQPGSDDDAIWRFMPFRRFEDLMRSGKLYFCRSDKFEDENEGLPTEEYARYVCAQMGPGHDLDNTIGHLVQQKESYFISCWYLFDHETARMWGQFGRDGVAICSRYGLLKAALDAMPDRSMLGLVRYGFEHVGWNVLRFITTKRPKFSDEREVRALIWKPEWAGVNRHIDINNKFHRKPLTEPPAHVLSGLRQSVDLQALIEGIVVSPEANPGKLAEIKQLVSDLGYKIPVEESSFNQFPHVVTDLAEIIRFSSR
jgi:hypothetical protein